MKSSENNGSLRRAPHLLSLLVAVLAAVGMWYVVSVRDRLEAQVEVNIDYYGIPPNLVVTDGLISKITVRLRGPETLLRSIPQQRLTQAVDLSDIKKGVTVVPLGGDNLGPPSGLLSWWTSSRRVSSSRPIRSWNAACRCAPLWIHPCAAGR